MSTTTSTAQHVADRRAGTLVDAATLTRIDAVVAGRQLPVRRPDLPARQPAAARAAARATTSSRACSATGAPRPGLNFLYAHLNRAIAEREQSTIYVTGPGHGGPGLVASAYLDGTYSEVYSDITEDAEGMRRLFRQFSFPGGIPSHVAPETPGLDPRGRRARLRAARTPTARRSTTPTCWSRPSSATARPRPARWPPAGTRTSSSTRARTASSCRSCTSTGTRSPTRRCSRASREDELDSPHGRLRPQAARVRRGGFDDETHADDPPPVRDAARRGARRDRRDQGSAPRAATSERPLWPMIVFRTPKGWTGPHVHRRQEDRGLVARAPGAAGQRAGHRGAPARCSSGWLRVVPRRGAVRRGRPRCDDDIARARPGGRPADERQPARQRRAAAQGPAPAGLPRLRGRRAGARAARSSEAPRVLGEWLTDVIRLNPDNFRIFGPGRDGVEPPAGGVRRRRTSSGTPSSSAPRSTSTWPARAA